MSEARAEPGVRAVLSQGGGGVSTTYREACGLSVDWRGCRYKLKDPGGLAETLQRIYVLSSNPPPCEKLGILSVQLLSSEVAGPGGRRVDTGPDQRAGARSDALRSGPSTLGLSTSTGGLSIT